ncbi:hypothetical protein Ddye_002556 [Dipteronia dyeriana]|uniref:SHSP domain-containing protein n=1 Tax=Dipteronia dyeriana TaxID=168575 RepID=A0AAD9XR58_9ROSI|nr:hypothetical protein Ddye_002545 [Dipteronia dyeriana]KAK2663982.1 hypothetical protein Ddye_002556 [Dipteronia dyeriana]
MANIREKTRGFGERTFSQTVEVREIIPSSGWTDDSNAHYLLLKLPGHPINFDDLSHHMYEVKPDVDESGHLTVSGERLQKATGDKFKIFMFEQTFALPHNSDIDQISGKMEGDILRITVPKRPLALEDHENVDQTNKVIYKQESPEDVHENKYRGGGVNDDINEIYKQDSRPHIDENKYGGGVGSRVVGGGCSGRLDHMDEKSKKNSQIDCFSSEVVVVMGVLALLLAIIYPMFGSAGHDGAV